MAAAKTNGNTELQYTVLKMSILVAWICLIKFCECQIFSHKDAKDLHELNRCFTCWAVKHGNDIPICSLNKIPFLNFRESKYFTKQNGIAHG